MSDAGSPPPGTPPALSPQPAAVKPGSLTIRIKDQDQQEITFKIKSTTRFEKIFDAWYDRQGKAKDSCRFLFDGSRISKVQTPADFDMEDEDVIEAFLEQVGGC